MSRSAFAYGRAAITRSCDRRSFAAETIFMARVNCWVLRTDRSRRRMSMRDAIVCRSGRLRARVVLEESRLEFRDRGDERFFRGLLELSGLRDRRENLVLLGLEVRMESRLPRRDRRDFQV